MTNFQSRLLIGAIYVGITIGFLLWDQLSAWVLIGVVQLFCIGEFYRLTTNLSKSLRWLSAFSGSMIFAMVLANQDSLVNLGSLVYLLVPIILVNLVTLLTSKQEAFLSNMLGVIGGWVYISLPLAFLARIGNLEFSETNTDILPYHGGQILVVFILIWLSDTGAYLAGRSFGKRPLWKSISPKKTIEGFIGGLVLTASISYFLLGGMINLKSYQLLILAVIVVFAGTAGDLFESQIKRSLGIKDSGTALGGHGGFLDRFDSILFAAPACYAYLRQLAVM